MFIYNFRKKNEGKFMKKIISFVVLFLLVFSFCSCSQQTEEEFLLDFSDPNGEFSGIDLDGYECTIIQEYDLDHPFQYPVGTLWRIIT